MTSKGPVNPFEGVMTFDPAGLTAVSHPHTAPVKESEASAGKRIPVRSGPSLETTLATMQETQHQILIQIDELYAEVRATRAQMVDMLRASTTPTTPTITSTQPPGVTPDPSVYRRPVVGDPVYIGGPPHEPVFKCPITLVDGAQTYGPPANSKKLAKFFAQQLITGEYSAAYSKPVAPTAGVQSAYVDFLLSTVARNHFFRVLCAHLWQFGLISTDRSLCHIATGLDTHAGALQATTAPPGANTATGTQERTCLPQTQAQTLATLHLWSARSKGHQAASRQPGVAATPDMLHQGQDRCHDSSECSGAQLFTERQARVTLLLSVVACVVIVAVKIHQVLSQISGNNGSWTNTDDHAAKATKPPMNAFRVPAGVKVTMTPLRRGGAASRGGRGRGRGRSQSPGPRSRPKRKASRKRSKTPRGHRGSNASGASNLSSMAAQPVPSSAAAAAVRWIQHMSDPFNVPPVPVGGCAAATGIWGSYSITKFVAGSGGGIVDAVYALYLGELSSLAVMSGYVQTTASGNNTFGGTGGTLVNASAFNQAAAGNIVGTARPISGAIKVTMSYNNSITPPMFYVGHLPAGGAVVATFGATTPNTLFSGSFNHKCDSRVTSVQANWTPHDIGDFETFDSVWLAATSGTTVPWIGITNMNGTTGNPLNITIEVIQFFQYQPTTFAQMTYFEPSPPVPYSTQDLYSEYLKLLKAGKGPKLIIENPKMAHGHGNKYSLSNSQKKLGINPLPEFDSSNSGHTIVTGNSNAQANDFEIKVAEQSLFNKVATAIGGSAVGLAATALANAISVPTHDSLSHMESGLLHAAPPAAIVQPKEPENDRIRQLEDTVARLQAMMSIQEEHTVRPQINGNNGSFTNTDDVNKTKGKRETREKLEALAKAAHKAVERGEKIELVCDACDGNLDYDTNLECFYCPKCTVNSSDADDEDEGVPVLEGPEGPVGVAFSGEVTEFVFNPRQPLLPGLGKSYGQMAGSRPGEIGFTVEPMSIETVSENVSDGSATSQPGKPVKGPIARKPCTQHHLHRFGIAKQPCRRKKCPWSHAPVDRLPTHCELFLKGRCKLGEQCPYTHPNKNDPPPSPPDTSDPGPIVHDEQPDEHSDSAHDDENYDIQDDIVYVYVHGAHVPANARHTYRLPCDVSATDEHIYGPLLTDIVLPVADSRTLIFLHCISLVEPASLSAIIANWGSVKSVDHEVQHTLSVIDGYTIRLVDSTRYTATKECATIVLPLPTYPTHSMWEYPGGAIYSQRISSPDGFIAACYTNTPNGMPSFQESLAPSIHDVSYYGPLALSSSTHTKHSVDEDTVTVRAAKHAEGALIQSYGRFVIFHSAEQKEYVVPKTYVHVAHRAAIGQMRDPELLQLVLRRLKSFDELINRDCRLDPNAIFVAAILGILAQLDAEADILHGSIPKKLAMIKAHSQALQFNFQRVWGRFAWSLLLGTGLAATISLAPYAAPLVPWVASAAGYLPIVWPASVAAVYASSTIASAASAAASSIRPLTTLNNAVPGQIINGANLSFSAVDPDYDRYHIENEEIDPTAYVHLRDIGTADPDRKNVLLLGIGNRFRIPTTFGQSGLAEAASIYKRIVKRQPYHTDQFNATAWDSLMSSVDNQFIESCFPGWSGNLRVPPFNDWLESRNYTLNLKLAYRKAWAQIKSGRIPVDDWTRKKRGCFVKMELNRKIGTPRAIQSGSIWDNAFKGPTCLGLGNLLSDTNGIHTNGPLYYVGGCTPEQIGALFDRIYVQGHDIMEGDFEKYDSSQHRRIFDLRNKLYGLAGVNSKVLASFQESMFTHGSTRHGNSYGVLATVTSGSMDTTVGNSLVQGTCIIRCLAEQFGSVEAISDAGISVVVYGDDNLIVAPPNIIDYTAFYNRMNSLGFTLQATVHQGHNAPYNATFCSQRFWPTSDGTVLGPCLYRAVSNLGWYCNPPPGVDHQALVKGDALGRLLQTSFIPILSHHWSRTIELAGDKTPVMPRRDHGFKMNERYHTPTPETWTMMKTVYGLTQADAERYNSKLQQVTTLGSVCDFPAFSSLCPNDDIIPTPVGSFKVDIRHSSVGQSINSILQDNPGTTFSIYDYTNYTDDVTPSDMLENIRGNRRHNYADLEAC